MPCWVKRACGLDSSVRSECQMPAVLSLLQSVVEHFADERIQQPAMYLVPNALLGQACLRFGQFRQIGMSDASGSLAAPVRSGALRGRTDPTASDVSCSECLVGSSVPAVWTVPSDRNVRCQRFSRCSSP